MKQFTETILQLHASHIRCRRNLIYRLINLTNTCAILPL